MSSSSTVVPLRKQESVEDPLTAVLRSGARRLLAEAIEAEADAFLAEMKALRLPDGRERTQLPRKGDASRGSVPVASQAVSDIGLRPTYSNPAATTSCAS